MGERRLKPREQGDIGELSAMEWLASKGAHVYVPVGHSPDVDLIAEIGGRLYRLEVKTCNCQNKRGRWDVSIATRGGNQSWCIGLTLGGPKYSEFEIEIGRPLEMTSHQLGLESSPPGEYRSGQTGHPVKVLAYAFGGSNPPSPITSGKPAVGPTKYERKLGQSGHAVINQKRRMTIPQRPFFEAGLVNGSKVRVRSDGAGRIVVEQIELPGWAGPEPKAD